MSVLKKPLLWATAAALTAAVALPGTAQASPGVLTPKPPYITLTVAGTVTPIISVGEVVDVEFTGLPDGIGIAPSDHGDGFVDVFVSHEETTVPFFAESDFQDASVTRWTLNTSDASVEHGEVAISSDNGYLRFCSGFMAGAAEGFSTYTYFANEETDDVVDVPTGAPYGADPALAPQRQGGYAVALNTDSGDFTQVAGIGRYNHENTVVVPGGWNQFAALSTDDTFAAPSSQLYMYLFNHESHLWQDKGSLWAFRVTRTQDGPVTPTDPFNGANDYLDLGVGDEFQGEFIRVPKQIARGLTGDAPQDALENWSNEHNVFQFIRLEDLTYDKNDPRIVYAADTGQTRIVPDPDTGRMMRGPGGTTGLADNGRIFKFVFDENNPKKVDSLTVLADGDNPGPAFVGFRHPDNMDTSANSLMVQEDTSNASIWRYDFGSTTWNVVATVNDPGGESSGIVDASEWFGAGSWLLDVQAHSTFLKAQMVDGVTLKQEDGQLMLMEIPGS